MTAALVRSVASSVARSIAGSFTNGVANSVVGAAFIAAVTVLGGGGCQPTITGVEVSVAFDPALEVDQLRFTLSASGAGSLDPITAPAEPTLLTSGAESAGFIVPDDMVDLDVTVDVDGLAADDVVADGSATTKAARGAIGSLDIELAAVGPGIGVCGDGSIDSGEDCDDDNNDDADGCSALCRIEFGFDCSGEPSVCQQCGDGRAQGSEGCDDANLTDADGCSACHVDDGFVCNTDAIPTVCTLGSCGDGIVAAGVEGCDDDANDNGDGCSAQCAVELGFQCSGEPSTCASVCGDGVIAIDEDCDDGDLDNGDGCSSQCAAEGGFQCDNASGTSVCSATCGDSLVRGAEQCDDGNANSDTAANACRLDCTAARCGDGVVDDLSGEGCDDVNTDNGDGCLTGCRAPSCGDGLIDPGSEDCDDGNNSNGDGCSSQCAVDPLFLCGGAPSICALLACVTHPCAHTVAPSGADFTKPSGAAQSGAVVSGDVVFVAAGVYDDGFDVSSKNLTLVGPAGGGAVIRTSANNDSVRVRNGRTLTLQGIAIENTRPNSRVALKVEDGTAVVDACVLGPTNGAALSAAGGTSVTLTRSLVHASGSGAVLSGDFVVENSVFAGNDGAGVSMSHAGVFRFNSVHDNGGEGVSCSNGALVNVDGVISVDNGGAAINGCADNGNNVTGIDARFVDDAHVAGDSPAIDVAGGACPAVDVDGDPRPIGGACEAGADERPRQ